MAAQQWTLLIEMPGEVGSGRATLERVTGGRCQLHGDGERARCARRHAATDRDRRAGAVVGGEGAQRLWPGKGACGGRAAAAEAGRRGCGGGAPPLLNVE